ncbi:DNA-protecting protein DprA [Candidatus Dependentiae bacterium]|nr:DNA-protecting protein DprA [Candidatus Dependentiae bacterium]
MNTSKILLHLSLIDGVGSAFIQKLVELIGVEALSSIYHFKESDFIQIGISQSRAQKLVQGLKDFDLLKKELGLIELQNIKLLTLWCQNYPERLKQISVPPVLLYCQGDSDLLLQEKLLACVGSRLAHSYARDSLYKIVIPMIQDGWIMVSGGALGADTYAHQMALDNNGKTIAVMGSGLCHQYPEKNKPLFRSILNAGGLLISSFSMMTRPDVYTFPIRNRIISGISVGCFVLQAAAKSGALITAQYALDQGREVFALPGPIYDPLSDGCHDLIKSGAKLVTKTQDILDELLPHLQNKEIRGEIIDARKMPEVVLEESFADQFVDPINALILQHTLQAVTTDDLSRILSIDLDLLHEKLFHLSLDGKIEQDCMGLWKIK